MSDRVIRFPRFGNPAHTLEATQSSTSLSSEPPKPEEIGNTAMFGDRTRAEKERWFLAVCAKLEHIDALEQGWDGHGAERIPKTTIHFTAMLLGSVWSESLPLGTPAITPMSNGAIMVEWRSRTHEVTAEVNNPNDVDVLFEDLGTGQSTEFHVTNNFTRISEALERSVLPVRVVA